MKAAKSRATGKKKLPTRQGKTSDYTVGYKKPPIEHRWKPGQSGNPSGKHATNHEELRKLIQEIGAELDEEGQTRLVAKIRAMFSGRNSRDNQNLFEHGFGTVPQDVNVNFSKMSDDELANYIAERTRALGVGIDGSGEAQLLSQRREGT